MSSLRHSAKGWSLVLMRKVCRFKAAQMDRNTWLLWVRTVRVGDLAGQMRCTSCLTLVNDPRRMALSVINAKNLSTWFSQEL